jgi:hypothetical protein
MRFLFSLCLLVVVSHAVAQSDARHSLVASGGLSLPVGIFARDHSGEGHGFANPGFATQLFYQRGRGESKLQLLGGLTFMVNPLDNKSIAAMWGPASVSSKNYTLLGISAGVLWQTSKSEKLSWNLKATVGAASITYPAHEVRYINSASNTSHLIYSSSADPSFNLNGSLGVLADYRVSDKLSLKFNADYFRTRSHHVITYINGPFAYPPTYEEDSRQHIVTLNIQAGVSYQLQ